jgi:hypothetical protein
MRRWSSVILVVALVTSAAPIMAQWGPIQRLSDTDSASVVEYVGAPLLAVGNTVLATWHDCFSGQSCVVQRRSSDNGATWGGVTRLTGPDPYKVSLVVGSGGNICLTYDSSSSMMLRHSSDFGASWSAGETLARWSSNGLLTANPDGYALFVWEDEDTVYCRRSTNSGASWLTKAPIRTAASIGPHTASSCSAPVTPF